MSCLLRRLNAFWKANRWNGACCWLRWCRLSREMQTDNEIPFYERLRAQVGESRPRWNFYGSLKHLNEIPFLCSFRFLSSGPSDNVRIKNKNLSSRFINWNSTKEKFHLVKSSVSCVFSKGCSVGGRGCLWILWHWKRFGRDFRKLFRENDTEIFRYTFAWLGGAKLRTLFGGWKVFSWIFTKAR